MESIRQSKISRLIQKELGEMFQKEMGHLRGHSMITVTHVSVTSDLSLARVHLSLFATSDKTAMFQKIVENKKEIRHTLAGRVKNQLRVIPDLEFFIDEALDYIEHIDELLKK